MVSVELGTTDDADAVTDLWVALAEGQCEFDSHLRAAANRNVVRDGIVRRAVADELLVARDGEADAPERASEGADASEPPSEADAPSQSSDEERDIVGFVTYGVESGAYEVDATRGVVQNVYVAPDRRGEGIGSELLDAAERRLADAGADVVALDVMADNDAARRFYRRHGYAPHRVELEKSVESDTLTKE